MQLNVTVQEELSEKPSGIYALSYDVLVLAIIVRHHVFLAICNESLDVIIVAVDAFKGIDVTFHFACSDSIQRKVGRTHLLLCIGVGHVYGYSQITNCLHWRSWQIAFVKEVAMNG